MTQRMLYSPLYSYAAPDDIAYFLATDAQASEDGMTLTVTLRDDVVWSDGEPFTADDVLFTFEHIIKSPHANGYDSIVIGGQPTKVTALDKYTVEFVTPVFTPSIISNVSTIFIMPKHIYEGDETLDNNVKNQTPVGTGPYTLAEYKAGQYVKFSANKTYFKGKPKIETVYFQIVGDMNSAIMALKTGQINALVLSNDVAKDFENSNVEVIAYPEDRVGYFSFIMTSDKVQDINFRKAVFFALDRTQMNVGAYLSEEFYTDAISFLPSSNPFFTDDLEAYHRNLDTAREYLAKAENVPESFTLSYAAGNVQQEVQALIIQQNLKEIGVNVEITPMESNALFDGLRKKTSPYDSFLSGYIMSTDPSNYATLFASDGAWNFAASDVPGLDDLFERGAIEPDQAKRREIYDEAQRLMADYAVQYPIVTNYRLLGITKDVGGIEEARLIPIFTFNDMSHLYFK